MDNIKNDKYYALKVVDNIAAINRYIDNVSYEEFIDDEMLVDAVMFRLVQLIENIKHISNEFKKNNPSIPWGKIIGFRNGIVHEYGKTDYSIVYEIAHNDLNELKDVFESLI